MTAIETLRNRARTIAQIRRFFDERGYLAVETPQLCPQPIPEAHIDLFATTRRFAGGAEAMAAEKPKASEPAAGAATGAPPASAELTASAEPTAAAAAAPLAAPPETPTAAPLYLLPSPEYYLKRLLARGSGSIYEITHSFRNSEYDGAHHAIEFTMLEYYTVAATADDSRSLTIDLLRAVGITAQPRIMTMAEAWHEFAAIDLAAALDREELGAAIDRAQLPMHVSPTETWEDLFQRVFLTYVEPELPRDRPLFLTDYPAAVPTLARQRTGTPWAERWELYLDGVETANCYTEETDPARIEAFQAAQSALVDTRARDEHFLQPPELLTECSGVALGVDRLIMHLAGAGSIAEVMAFVPGVAR